MSVTYAVLAKAVADAFGESADIQRVQAFDDLTEGIVDVPLVRVVPDSGDVDAGTGNTTSDRSTFQVGTRQTHFTLIADGYARRRSNLAEDIAAQMKLIDAMDAVLCAQKANPLFGQAAVKNFSWKWERATFRFGASGGSGVGAISEEYAGCRFTITLFIY